MARDESERFYRYQHQHREGWNAFQVKVRETDLWIRAQRELSREAMDAVLNCRRHLEFYMVHHPDFLHSLNPLPYDPLAPELVKRMLLAAQRCGVGPMAAVAGAVAEFVAIALKSLSPLIIIENGGDCYMDLDEETTIGVYAGKKSPFTGRIGLRFSPDRFPLGICTSSGTIGHSLSFGRADAVTVVARDTALADAAATAIGNAVKTPRDVGTALELAGDIEGLDGVLIVCEDKMGARGNLEIIPL
jgi:ApbE superfamily uncharacterized protein (UPF0280 family)